MYLSFKDLTISYGKKVIVENINLDVPKGEIVTLVGKNGSGKSTILKTLTNSAPTNTGGIYLDGRKLSSYKLKEIAQKMAILPQIYEIPGDIDVETLISYGRYPYKIFGKPYSKEDKKIIEETIEITGLKDLRHQRVDTLSGGERQRARIAMSICQRPQILVLDEPTTYLDISFQLEILELISRINEEMNISILMVLHDLNLAAQYSDLIYVLDDKTVYKKGDPDTIIGEKILNEVFEIDVAIWKDNPTDKPFFMPLGIIKKE